MALLFALAVSVAGPLWLGSTSAGAAGLSHARVVIILGPVGDLTPLYRSSAEAAAAEARRWSDQVITVYTPNATWPAVSAALQGASVVVYIGHGNGFPSPYRSVLYPETQNGLGLNPVAGGDDSAHQYFGERYLAAYVHLAPHAVVILHRLCYASGNPEPGGPEPTPEVAVQRADNYSAGFMAAGAGAVLVDARLGADYYIRALLGRGGGVDAIWRDAPSAHGNLRTLASARTPGAAELLDPDTSTSGYFRSLVLEPGLTATQLLAGASQVPPRTGSSGTVVAAGGDTAAPSAAVTNFDVVFGSPSLGGIAVAGSVRQLSLPVTVPGKEQLPATVMIGVRWDPLESAASGTAPPAAASSGPASPASTPTARAAGSASAEAPPLCAAAPPSPSAPPVDLAAAASPVAGGSSACPAPAVTSAGEPPAVALVAVESPGKVVTTAATRREKSGLAAAVTVPDRPGLYRLVLTLHDARGVAFGPDVQTLIPALLVRVTGDLWAIYGLDPEFSTLAGVPVLLKVRVENAGSSSWGTRPPASLVDALPAGPAPRLVARWQPLGAPDRSPDRVPLPVSVAAYLEPGASAVLPLSLTAPSVPGAYLLVLDIVTPGEGSLAALGVPPGLARVMVTGAEAAPPPADLAPASPPPAGALFGLPR